MSRAGTCAGLACLLLLAAAGSVHDATALGETRTLSFHHTHSGEDLTVTFKRNGRYDEAALKELNHFLRDWRTQDQTTMDRHLFDILWEVYRDVDAKQPIQIISAYRSPATNAMLRRRSAHTGVARFSQHMLGHAMDFFIPGVPLEQIRYAGLRLQRGGVGFYPTSGSPFVHLDTGNIRHWPRMTHDQLVRVFPNGRTVHIPSDGKPLPGYQLAMADIERRGQNADEDGAAPRKSNFLLAMFKSRSADDDDEADTPSAQDAAKDSALASAVLAKADNPIPMPRAKPSGATFQLASADVRSVMSPPAKQANAELKPQTPADIINSRGFWGDTPATAKQATPEQVVAAVSAREALARATADPRSTSSISDAFQALAYAPAARPPRSANRERIIAASASLPRIAPPTSPARNPMAVNDVTTVVAKSARGQTTIVSTSRRLAAATVRDGDAWMRAMILSPSANAMRANVMGDADMTLMRVYFVKPDSTVAMTFTPDPSMGLIPGRFTGPAVAALTTTAFATASLR